MNRRCTSKKQSSHASSKVARVRGKSIAVSSSITSIRTPSVELSQDVRSNQVFSRSYQSSVTRNHSSPATSTRRVLSQPVTKTAVSIPNFNTGVQPIHEPVPSASKASRHHADAFDHGEVEPVVVRHSDIVYKPRHAIPKWNTLPRSNKPGFRQPGVPMHSAVTTLQRHASSTPAEPVTRPTGLDGSRSPTGRKESNSSPLDISITPKFEPQQSVSPSLLKGDFTLHGLMDKTQKDLLRSIKGLLSEIERDLAPLGLTTEDAQLLRDASDALDELFLVVAFGEFNSGKSSLLNALLGGDYCKTGVLPTTDQVNVYRYGEKVSESVNGNTHTKSVPVEWLRLAHLVDTPGTNAIIHDHQQISERYIPNADLVLFVTSVERPFSESERSFLEKIKVWGKKVVFVLNKADLIVPNLSTSGVEELTSAVNRNAHTKLTTPPVKRSGQAPTDDLLNVMEFVQYNAAQVLEEAPPIFSVSSQLALKGKTEITSIKNSLQSQENKVSSLTTTANIMQAQALIANSGFSALENYILHQLSGKNKIQIKLSNPLSISRKIIATYNSTLNAHIKHLDTELDLLEQSQVYIDQYKTTVVETCKKELTPLNTVFEDLNSNSMLYIKQIYNVSSILSMLSGRIGGKFANNVVTEKEDDITNATSSALAKLHQMTHRLSLVLGQNMAHASREGIDLHSKQQEQHLTDEVASTASAGQQLLALGPQLISQLSQSQTNHTQNLQQLLDNTLLQDIPNSISSKAKKGASWSAALSTGGIALLGASMAVFPDPTIIMAGVGLLATGIATFPIIRSSLRRDVTSQLKKLKSSLESQLQENISSDVEQSVAVIDTCMKQIRESLTQERELVQATANRLHTLKRDINAFETSIQDKDNEPADPSNKESI